MDECDCGDTRRDVSVMSVSVVMAESVRLIDECLCGDIRMDA